MGFSRYVGRVGALAVVLGVGTVVAFPQTALADEGDGSGGSTAVSSQEPASGTSGAAGAETNVEAPTVTASDPTTNSTATGTQDASGDAPSSTVSAQTNTGSSTQTSAEPSTEPASPEPTTEPVVIEEPTGETPVTPDTPPPAEPTGTETPTADPTAGSDSAPMPTATPTAPEASTPSKSTTEPAAVAPRSLQAATNATQQPGPSAETLSQRMTLTTTAALAPAAPALDPLSALLAIPVSIVTTLVNAVLTPFLGGAPAAPAQPPLLWAVLAWVRREFQRTFANSTPVAPNQNITISLALPNAVSGPIAFGATDANGDRLTYTVPARGAVGGPTHGTVTVDQATGTFTYNPDDAYALTGGTDTFTYTVSDAGARRTIFGIPLSFSPTTATGTVAVTLNRVNVAPVINGDDRTTLEDTPVTIAVLGNDTDANGNPLAVTGVTQATNGTTTFTASGVTYTPNANYYGTDSFTYTASDGALTGTATVTVTVTQLFDDLVAVNDTATVAEDSGTKAIDVLANDTDIDGGPKTITAVTQPTNGTVAFTGTTLSYTPNANFTGTETFTYTVNGGPTATVTVTVTPVEDNPVAVNDTAIVAEDSGTTLIDVLANDTDVDGGATTITGVIQPTNGTVTFTGTTLSYTPNANYNGTDTITYTLNGGSTATVSMTVSAVNDPPVAPDQNFTVVQGTTVAFDLFTGASDVDGDRIYIVYGSVQTAQHGVTYHPGSGPTFLTYTPTPGFIGQDTYSFRVQNADGASTGVTTTITFTVIPAPDAPPVAENDVATIAEDSGTTLINVLANDTDVDAGPKTITGVTPPTGGTVTFTGTTLSYTPNANFNGTDSFTYTLNGGSTATATITVTSVNDGAPVFGQVISTPGVGNTWVVSAPATDIDGDALTTTVSSTTPVTVTRLSDSTFRVTVDPTWASAHPGAQVPVTLTVADIENATATTTLVIGTVNNVIGLGANPYGQLNIPALPAGITYTQVASGLRHTVLLRSDGTAVAVGSNADGALNIPQLPEGVTYTRVAASWAVTVLLRSDGTAVAFGNNEAGKLNIPPLPAGITYTQVATNVYHTVLLRSDGTAVAVGNNGTGALNIPQPPDGITYTQVAASVFHTVLLRSDGTAVAVGDNGDGQLNIPAPPAGITYTQVAAGINHTVLLRSDGVAIAIGGNGDGQLNIPPLSAGVTYTRVAAGEYTTVLLRSDGTAVAVGSNGAGQLNIPQPPTGVVYTQVSASRFNTMLLSSTSAAPANTPPVAVNDAATVAEGGTTNITVTNNDTDANGTVDVTTVVITRQPTAGTATVNANGTVTYANNGSEARTDGFAYKVKDNTGALSNEATVTMTITAVNDAPVAVGDTATVAAGGTTTITLTANDTDVDNAVNPATIVITRAPTAGTITVNSNGTVAYTSTGTTATTDTFTYTVKDASGATSNTATVTISVTAAANTPPVAVNDAATVAEGGSTTIAVTTNDTDANGTVDVTTIVITRQPTSGTATVNANGSITYANNGSEARTDSFGYKVKDNTGTLSNEATVTMTITAVNDAPVAANDTATVAEGGSTTIAVTTNDTDGDGTVDVTTVVITRQPTSGTATVNANGSVTYASNGSEVTADGFAYKVKDNSGALSNEATVTITITPVNDGPTAVNDAYTVAANGTLTVNAPGLLANDTDPDGAFLRLTEIFTPGHGTLSGVLSSGTFTYRPDTGYVGTDSFTYTVGDGAATSQGIVTITVTADPNNVAPVGNADSYTVNEDTVLTVNGPGLLANDTDANGQTLKVVSIGTEPTRGSLVLNDDGSFTYTPGPNLNGTDTFTYKASDGAADTAFTTVTINVAAVNDAPVINNDTIPIAKDTFVAFALGNRSSDVDGDVLTGTVVSGPQHGTFYFDTVNRGFSYQPNAGYTGTDSFTYKVSDGKLDSAIATVTLTVA